MTIYVLTRGGFGNVLFNYMIGFVLSKQYGHGLFFIDSDGAAGPGSRQKMSKYIMYRKAVFSANLPELYNRITERGFTYSEIPPLGPSELNYVLDGYFQSWKYSKEYLQQIKDDLIFSHPMRMTMMRLHDFYRLNGSILKPTVMLHVRRGDYLTKPDIHPVQTDEYFTTSLQKMRELVPDFKLLCFSDDVEFLRGKGGEVWPVIKDYDYRIVDLEDIEDTFLLMTNCSHFIISNSSFSLLAYYFRDSPDSILCMPKNWFGPRGPAFRLEEIVEMNSNVYVF